MQLKREMLITLSKKDTDLYPNDKEKQQLIYNRYKALVKNLTIFFPMDATVCPIAPIAARIMPGDDAAY